MRPLDIVRTKNDSIGMIKEVSTTQGIHKASIRFFKTCHEADEKSAWWGQDEFEVIDNVADILSQGLAHPMGSNSLQPYSVE